MERDFDRACRYSVDVVGNQMMILQVLTFVALVFVHV